MSYSMTTLDGGEIWITDEEVQAFAAGARGQCTIVSYSGSDLSRR